MSKTDVDEIQAQFDELLSRCERYYRGLKQELAAVDEQPDGEGRPRAAVETALLRATELIEVLESVTYDRLHRLADR